MDTEPSALQTMGNALVSTGVTAFLPTTMTYNFPRIYQALDNIRNYMLVKDMDGISNDDFTTRMYACAKDNNLEAPVFFQAVYQVLIAKDRGPKLADFIHSCGKGKVEPILARYC